MPAGCVEVAMKARTLLLRIIAPVVIVGGAGYVAAYSSYHPQITDLKTNVSGLISEVVNLNTTVSSQQSQLRSLQSERDALTADLSRARDERAALQTSVASLQEQVKSSTSQATTLKTQLANVLDITVNQNYQWTYARQTFQWEFPIPLSLYDTYRERPRPTSLTGYVQLAMDPGDDQYIDQLVQRINETAVKNGYSDAQKLNFVTSFVQSLPYTVDSETTHSDEYPRYPVETLFDRGGDCEDTSILVAALFERMGYDTALLVLPDAAHMAVGVALPSNNGSYFPYEGRNYYYLETTGTGWRIGQIPPGIASTGAEVYPLKN